jgi:hypothetical protein
MSGDFEVTEQNGLVIARRVALFDEHVRDGITFDRQRLERIAANCNKRILDTGDRCPLVPGHQPDDKPEEEVTILGWADNFVVGEWGMVEPRSCIFADLLFTPEMWEVAKGLPRRSIELWMADSDEAFIDPVALLSSSTPHRDLGLLYSKKNAGQGSNYRYELKGGRVDKDELKKMVCELIKEYMAEADEKKAEDKPSDEEPQKSEAAEEEKKKDEADEDKEKLKNERDQFARKYARLETDHKLLASRLADLEKKERVSTRKADLLQIEAEGVLFDMNEELASVSDLGDKEYTKHLDVMRKRYSRSPVGVHVPVASMPAHGVSKLNTELTQDQVRKAAELLWSGKAKSQDEALNMVKGV